MPAQSAEPNTRPELRLTGAAETDPYWFLDKLLYTIDEACELLAIKRTTMFTLLKDGTIHSIQVGRSRRIPRHALIQFSSNLTSQ